MAITSSVSGLKGVVPATSSPRTAGPKIQRSAASRKTASTTRSPLLMGPNLPISRVTQSRPPGIPGRSSLKSTRVSMRYVSGSRMSVTGTPTFIQEKNETSVP